MTLRKKLPENTGLFRTVKYNQSDSLGLKHASGVREFSRLISFNISK